MVVPDSTSNLVGGNPTTEVTYTLVMTDPDASIMLHDAETAVRIT